MNDGKHNFRIYYRHDGSRMPKRARDLFNEWPQCNAVVVMARGTDWWDAPAMPYYSAIIVSGDTKKLQYDPWLRLDVNEARMERELEYMKKSRRLAHEVLAMLNDMPVCIRDGEAYEPAERWDVVPKPTLEDSSFQKYDFCQPVQVAIHDRMAPNFRRRWQGGTVYAHGVDDVRRHVEGVIAEEASADAEKAA